MMQRISSMPTCSHVIHARDPGVKSCLSCESCLKALRESLLGDVCRADPNPVSADGTDLGHCAALFRAAARRTHIDQGQFPHGDPDRLQLFVGRRAMALSLLQITRSARS